MKTKSASSVENIRIMSQQGITENEMKNEEKKRKTVTFDDHAEACQVSKNSMKKTYDGVYYMCVKFSIYVGVTMSSSARTNLLFFSTATNRINVCTQPCRGRIAIPIVFTSIALYRFIHIFHYLSLVMYTRQTNQIYIYIYKT